MQKDFDLKWITPETLTNLRDAKCKVCGKNSANQIIEITLKNNNSNIFIFWKCYHCCSIFCNPFTLPDYSLSTSNSALSSTLYCEIGAGILSMIQPVLKLTNKPKKVLEVGAGFGYFLDFVRFNFSSETVGLEPGHYGKEGAKCFDLDIRPGLIDSVKGEYDLIYAIEILEHIEDPVKFATSLYRLAGKTGIVVLTTPNSRAIIQTENVDNLFLLLFPGFHHVIFSKEQAEFLFRQVGFSNVTIIPHSHSLWIYASNGPLPLDSETDNQPINLDSYFKYMNYRAIKTPPNNISAQLGFLYRNYKDLVNLGMFEDASLVWGALIRYYKKSFGLDINDTTAVLKKTHKMAKLAEYRNTISFALGAVFYYRGKHLSYTDPNNLQIVSFYSASEQLCKLYNTIEKTAEFFSSELAGLINLCSDEINKRTR